MNAMTNEAHKLEQNSLENKLSKFNLAISAAVMDRRALKIRRAEFLMFNVDSADLYTEVLNSYVYYTKDIFN
jgi:hypothetical protein